MTILERITFQLFHVYPKNELETAKLIIWTSWLLLSNVIFKNFLHINISYPKI